jgi:hypothetical protein
VTEPQWPTTDQPGQPGPPPITDAMRAAARSQPGTWLYVIDAAFDPTGNVPNWGVAGGYPVDAAGEIAPDFTANPDYRPSPLTLGMAAPVTELEGALQLAATGYSTHGDLLAVLVTADVITPARSAQDMSVAVFRDGEGRSVVPVFSSDQHLPADVTGWRRLPMADLLAALPGRYLAIDPGTPVTVTLPGEQVISAGQAH